MLAPLTFSNLNFFKAGVPFLLREPLKKAAATAAKDVLAVKKGEQALIITNPQKDVLAISAAMYDAVLAEGGRPALIIQNEKDQIDFAEPAVIAAFAAKPEIVISLSSKKLGKDKNGVKNPYPYGNVSFDHIFHLLQYGEKSCRAFWSPGVTLESFCRTVRLDYAALRSSCKRAAEILTAAESVTVKAPGGTDIKIGVLGRIAKQDDGAFSFMGSGGNLPAGEAFISPQNGTSNGVIAFDGSITLNSGDILIRKPIICTVKDGFAVKIEGGSEAGLLRDAIKAAEASAFSMEKDGLLPKGKGAVYAKNASNIGELGIGLNVKARITGNMLEDEKAFKTCHFAIGHNYDEDAPSLIHLDGLVRLPTITAFTSSGEEIIIEKEGVLQ
ncbi:MAG: aminopeptidase [Spirochaetaceae bacterium]|nr:aminopeptidase [Spirochaetaceae bacterium]